MGINWFYWILGKLGGRAVVVLPPLIVENLQVKTFGLASGQIPEPLTSIQSHPQGLVSGQIVNMEPPSP